MAVKQVDAHTLKVTCKGTDGMVREENTFVLSSDGKSIRETDVTPQQSTTVMVLRNLT